MLRKTLAALLCVAAVFTSFSACTVLSSTSEEKEIVLTVGDYEVPYELYYYISQMLMKDMPDASPEEIEAEVFEMLREIYAVFSLAEDFGIDMDDEYIDSIVDDAVALAIEECGGKSEYKKALGENYMNDSVFRFLKRHSHTADELLYAIINSGKYPVEEKSLIALIEGEEFVCVKQILILGENASADEEGFFKAGVERTDDEALVIAEKVRDKALKGESFDALVNEYGEALYMFNNPDGYYVCRGMWEEETEEVIFSLEVGEVSEVVKSSQGYSVFVRCDKNSAYVRSKLDSIADEYYKAQYNLLLRERIEALEVIPNEAYESHLSTEEEK